MMTTFNQKWYLYSNGSSENDQLKVVLTILVRILMRLKMIATPVGVETRSVSVLECAVLPSA